MGMVALIAVMFAAICVAVLVDLLMEKADESDRKSSVVARVNTDAAGSMEERESRRTVLPKPGNGKLSEAQVNRDLLELIDVLGMGMEAGMSFENAFLLYSEKFDSALSRKCRPAALMMANGLVSREEAMRDLSEEIGSKSFTRFTQIVLRSVRFGSGLLPMLDGLSDDIRKAYRSDVEEKISTASTKMLIPTGVFILPAMLLLVAGPILVDLVEQI